MGTRATRDVRKTVEFLFWHRISSSSHGTWHTRSRMKYVFRATLPLLQSRPESNLNNNISRVWMCSSVHLNLIFIFSFSLLVARGLFPTLSCNLVFLRFSIIMWLALTSHWKEKYYFAVAHLITLSTPCTVDTHQFTAFAKVRSVFSFGHFVRHFQFHPQPSLIWGRYVALICTRTDIGCRYPKKKLFATIEHSDSTHSMNEKLKR